MKKNSTLYNKISTDDFILVKLKTQRKQANSWKSKNLPKHMTVLYMHFQDMCYITY